MKNKNQFVRDNSEGKIHFYDREGRLVATLNNRYTSRCPGRKGVACSVPGGAEYPLELRQTEEGTLRDQPCCSRCRSKKKVDPSPSK